MPPTHPPTSLNIIIQSLFRKKMWRKRTQKEHPKP
jgi:hypothetical protein